MEISANSVVWNTTGEKAYERTGGFLFSYLSEVMQLDILFVFACLRITKIAFSILHIISFATVSYVAHFT